MSEHEYLNKCFLGHYLVDLLRAANCGFIASGSCVFGQGLSLHYDSVYATFYRMIDLVIDTDVFVAALLSRSDSSVAREVIRRCLQGHYQPLFGVTLFSEYETLLSRDKLFAGCSLNHREREAVFAALLNRARWVEIYFAWRPNLNDEGDNHLIEVAVAGGAQAVVSRNTRDLKRAELLFPATQILTPKQCLEVFKCPP